MSKDSDQTETAPRKFKLGPLGSLNQVTKGLAKTRAGAVLARLYDRAGRADDAQGIPRAIRPDRRAGENAIPSPPSHVEARLRLRAGQCRPHDTRALRPWLGHKNIQHTVRYTELAPDRFKNFWR